MEKQKALDMAILQIEKQFGKGGSIMKLGGQTVKNGIEVIPSGCLSLDIALGIGGVPTGGKSRGNLWTRVIGKDNGGPACHCRGSKGGGAMPLLSMPNMLLILIMPKTGRKCK